MSIHAFNSEIASVYGVEAAIIISHFMFWIEQNEKMGRNFHEGRYWMYQTQKEIAAVYPYWKEDFIQRTIKKLVQEGVLIVGNFNATPFDRTQWYAFKNKEMFTILKNCGMHPEKLRNAFRESAESDSADFKNGSRESAECIIGKDTNTDIEKNKPTPSAVVVIPKFLDDLDIPETLKKKLLIDYKDCIEKLQKAAERCLKWKGRDDDTHGIMAALSKADTWCDNPTKEQIEEKNKKILNNYKYLDGKKINEYNIVLGHRYIEFFGGTTTIHIDVEDNEFNKKLNECLKYVGV